MKSIRGSLVGLVLAGILAHAPTAAFAHGGGGGGFGGGGGGPSGGSFSGAGGHSGGGRFGVFAGRSFAGHSYTQYQGAHYARHGDHFRHDRYFFLGGPFGYGYPYDGYDYPYYGNYDDDTGENAYGQSSPAGVTPFQEIIIAVQKELTQLGYYHGPVDGLMGLQTENAIRWFQSVDRLPVTGLLDVQTLKALQIS